MSVQRALIVDNEADIRELLAITLDRMGIETTAAADIAGAKGFLKKENFDLCLTDLRLPDGKGLELVEHIQKTCPSLPVAVITAYGSMEAAIGAMKLGAYDFVSKPINLKMLRDLVNGALKISRKPAPPPAPGEGLIGSSPSMLALKASIAKLARSHAPLCILGESGSGKERVAREVHRLSPRWEGPFVAVNCGAIPSELMESEFFGHVKGSFTGAVFDKEGLFQAASGGTLFLDEIAELPLVMQVKLLRAIQERAIKPVGAAREVQVDVRIVSATHRNLAEDVRTGRFRQDLYYRINVIEIAVPPLRERRDDLTELSRYFLHKIGNQLGNAKFSLSAKAAEKLSAYPFPGNVRELENILERAAALSDGEKIGPEAIQLPTTAEATEPAMLPSSSPLEEFLDAETKKALMAALDRTHWNRTAAAKQLGITLRQLRYRLKKLGLE